MGRVRETGTRWGVRMGILQERVERTNNDENKSTKVGKKETVNAVANEMYERAERNNFVLVFRVVTLVRGQFAANFGKSGR